MRSARTLKHLSLLLALLVGAAALAGCGTPAPTPVEQPDAGGRDVGTAGQDAGSDATVGPTCAADPLLADVETLPNQGNQHVADGVEVTYTSNPPASGPHYAHWIHSGVYDRALDPRGYVHNLEHGWVVLLYRPDAPAATVKLMEDFWFDPPADPECPGIAVPRILVSPAPDLPAPVAAVAWTHVLRADSFDQATLEAFFRACRNAATEMRVCADGGEPVFR